MVAAMKKSFLPVLSLALCLLAAGCTDADWNHMLNYGGMGEAEAAPPPAQAAAQAEAQAAVAAAPGAPAEPANADFCRNVAAQDATRNGFDAATQKLVFARSFQQCVAIYTR
jgi:hypothetical protein